jgi:hypothetical protein
VTVGGRRARTIDIHGHLIIPEATAMLAREDGTGRCFADRCDLERERFPRVDEWGTDMHAEHQRHLVRGQSSCGVLPSAAKRMAMNSPIPSSIRA